LEDGSVVLAQWSYFHILWVCRFSWNVEWHLLTDRRSEDCRIVLARAQELAGDAKLNIPFLDRFGGLICIGTILVLTDKRDPGSASNPDAGWRLVFSANARRLSVAAVAREPRRRAQLRRSWVSDGADAERSPLVPEEARLGLQELEHRRVLVRVGKAAGECGGGNIAGS
jgi:hypothetical protein